MIPNNLTRNAQRVRIGGSNVVCIPAEDFDQIIHEYSKLYYEKPTLKAAELPKQNPAQFMSRDMNSLLSIKEAAELFSVGRSTMWSYLKDQNAPRPIKIGRSTRYRYSELLDFISQNYRK